MWDRTLAKIQITARTVSLLLLFVLLASALAGAMPAYAAPVAQGGVQRIRFAPGATSAVVEGNIGGGQVARYVLTALAGQTMSVQIYSDGTPFFVNLFDPSRTIMGAAQNGEQWSGRLPSTGDYLLIVYPAPYTGNTNYQLRVEITTASPPPTPAAERIRFSPGATSAQVAGFLPSGASKSYVLGARSGQVMSIESWSNSGPFRYTVTDANGAVLGSGSQGERWSGTLPHTQDYRIVLQSPADATAAHYGLVITINNATPAPTATPVPAPAAERIRFPRGATSVTLTGYVDSYTPARYVLRALRGQTMTVSLNTLYENETTVSVYDERGYVLGTTSRGQRWSGYLPSTGDYFVEVRAPNGNTSDNFSLWIEIR